MPAILANVNKFRLTTDYPIEKVVYKTAGTVSVNVHPTHSDAQIFTFPHGLGFVPLCRGVYRIQSSVGNYDWVDFDTSIPFQLTSFGSVFTWSDGVICVAYSDATNIYLYVWNNLSAILTLDYRIAGFMDDIATANIAPTNTLSSGYLFNSDKNYLKIIQSGTGSQVITPGTVLKTFTHGLGYKPQVYVWTYNPGTATWGASGTESYRGVSGFDTTTSVDNSNLYLNFNSFDIGGTAQYAYRIFADA